MVMVGSLPVGVALVIFEQRAEQFSCHLLGLGLGHVQDVVPAGGGGDGDGDLAVVVDPRRTLVGGHRSPARTISGSAAASAFTWSWRARMGSHWASVVRSPESTQSLVKMVTGRPS